MYFAYIVATVGWVGLLPAPGTATSIVAAIAAYAMLCKGVSGPWVGAAAVGVFIVGMYVVPAAEMYMCSRWGPRRRHTGALVTSDYQQTTIDELHGQLIASLPVFFFGEMGTAGRVAWIALSCAAFRAFDITKPWPVGWLERRFADTPFGIMADDTAAGALAAAVVTAAWLV